MNENFKNIKIIALDMDGTLLNSRGEISEYNKEVLKKARQKGYIVSICTGRFTENASMVAIEEGIDCSIIALNGCVVSDKRFGEKLFEGLMPSELSNSICDVLIKYRADFFMFLPKIVISSNSDIRHHSELSQGDSLRKHGVKYLFGYDEAKKHAGQGVYKYFVLNREHKIDLEQLKKELLKLDGLYITSSGSDSAEIMPEGIDKARGIFELAKHYGYTLENAMAFGDYFNDLSMLEGARAGVAMGNAPDEVKKRAGYVCLSNDEDGVGRFIEETLLKY